MKAYIKMDNDLSINGKKYKLGKTYLDNFKLKFYENINDIFHENAPSSTFDLSNSGIYEVEIHDVVRTFPKSSSETIYFATYKFIILKEVDYSSIKGKNYEFIIKLYKNFKKYNQFEFFNYFKNDWSIRTNLFKAFFYNICKKDISFFDKYEYVIDGQIDVFFSKFPEKYHNYLTYSDDISDKFLLINFGRIEDLDCFLDESDPRLIERIIEKGRDKDLDLFINNKFTEIRMAVARNCRKKDLLILKDDKSKEIKEFVKSVLEIEK